MFELPDLVARGALARVTVLRGERLTRDADHLLNAVMHPGTTSLWTVFDAAVPGSHPAVTREQKVIEHAYVLMREERAESLARARRLLDECAARIGPAAATPYVDGRPRRRLIARLAIAMSAAGDEPSAIKLSQFLLDMAGAHGPLQGLADRVRDSPNRPHIAIQLNNIASRKVKLGYLSHLEGNEQGQRLVGEGIQAARESLALRSDEDDPRAVGGRLISRSNILRGELELAAMVVDPVERTAALEEVCESAMALVHESLTTPSVRPSERLARVSVLGMVFSELALAGEERGETERARELATMGALGLRPIIDLYDRDADESPSPAIRYGDACRLSGSPMRATKIWSRTRDRLALYRGDASRAVVVVEERITLCI